MAILSDKQIKKFQEIIKDDYGREFSWEDASETAHNIVQFFKFLHNLDLKDH